MENFSYKKCELKTNDKFGRFVVAANDIKAGELLLSELPIVAGPYWGTKLNCLNCYGPSDIMCKKCKVVPLCWSCCDLHDPLECCTLNKFNLPVTFLIDNFDVVTPLRILLQLYQYAEQSGSSNTTTDGNSAPTIDNDGRKDKFIEMLSMESHCAKRRGTWIWQEHKRNVIEPLRNIAKIDDIFRPLNLMQWQISDDFLQKICGILDVNTFEVRTPNFEEFPVRGLYTQAALLSHDCIGNTFTTVDNAKQMKIYASMDIKAGEIVCHSYAATLYGTDARQEFLTRGKYFECNCRRCIDPTECGTMMSSVKCRSCTISYMVQLQRNGEWTCLNCNAKASHEQIQMLLREIRQHMHNIDSNVDRMEWFVEKYSQVLHPNHYLLIDVKQKLAAIIRYMLEMSEDTATSKMPMAAAALASSNRESLLARKIELCKEFIPLLSVLSPGISRNKAIALYEQFIPLVQLAKMNHQRKTIDNVQYLKVLCEAEEIAKESIRMLLYEPLTNPEGMLARQAMRELKEMRTIKQQIENAIKKTKSN